MKKYLLLTALAACVLPGVAQDNSAKLALAREAIAATQIDKMFDSMAGSFKQMAAQQVQLPASASPEEQKKFAEYMDKVVDLSMQEAKAMISQMDAIYADVYSEAELKAMVAFFKSPEGQSMIAKQPQVMAKVMPLAQEMQRNLMPKILKLAEEATGELTKPAPAPAPAPAK